MMLLDVQPPPPPPSLRKAWVAGEEREKADIATAFLLGTSGFGEARDALLAERIRSIAEEWTVGTGLRLVWIGDPDHADVRIGLRVGWCCSYVGVPPALPPDKPTLNIDGAAELDDERLRYLVLHEFGHMLGFIHEHQAPGLEPEWNLEAIRERRARLGRRPRSSRTSSRTSPPIPRAAPTADPDSVMCYDYPARWTKNGVAGRLNTRLSPRDLEGAKALFGHL